MTLQINPYNEIKFYDSTLNMNNLMLGFWPRPNDQTTNSQHWSIIHFFIGMTAGVLMKLVVFQELLIIYHFVVSFKFLLVPIPPPANFKYHLLYPKKILIMLFFAPL